jgi:integrase
MVKHTITKTKNRKSKYRLRYAMNGITKNKYFKFKKDIEIFLKEINKETAVDRASNTTTSEAIKMFLAYKKPLISIKHYCDLVYTLEKIEDATFDIFRDQKSTCRTIEKLFYKKDGSLYSRSMIRRSYSAVKLFLDYCVKREYLPENYAISVKKPQQYQRKHITSDDVYNSREFLEILEHIPTESRLFFALIFFCGLRTEEALGMKGSDISNNSIYIRRAVVRFSKKNAKLEKSYAIKGLKHRAVGDFRKFQLPKALEQYLPASLTNDFFFKPVMNYAKLWRRAVSKSKLPYHTPYSLRSSCITRWLEILPISEISYRCGTSQEMILKVYGRRLNINQELYNRRVDEQNL